MDWRLIAGVSVLLLALGGLGFWGYRNGWFGGAGGSNYSKVPDTDYGGNDITHLPGKKVEDLEKECDGLKGCVGFNTHGYLKSKTENMVVSKGVDFYRK